MATHHDIIRKAISEGKQLQIEYNTESENTNRKFLPMYLFQWDNHYYVSGHCYLRNESRTLKISRIADCQLLNVPRERKTYAPVKLLNSSYFTIEDLVIDTYPVEMRDTLKELSVRFKQDFMPEYPKEIMLPKMKAKGTVRSPLEERILRQLSEDPKIILLEVEPFRIPYELDGRIKNYIPDVLVTYSNKEIKLIEIKVSGDINDPKNQAKFKVARNFCEERGYEFIILGVEGPRTNRRGRRSWDEDPPEIQTFPSFTQKPDIEIIKPNYYSAWTEWKEKYVGLSASPKIPQMPEKLATLIQQAIENNSFPKGIVYQHKLLANRYWENKGGTLLSVSMSGLQEEVYVLITSQKEQERPFSMEGIVVREVVPSFYMDVLIAYKVYPFAHEIVSDSDWLGKFRYFDLKSTQALNKFIRENRILVEKYEVSTSINETIGKLYTRDSQYILFWDQKDITDEGEWFLPVSYCEDLKGFLWFDNEDIAEEALKELEELRDHLFEGEFITPSKLKPKPKIPRLS
ncbi:WYL domain-containing protein [Paenibacillus pabuli]|uniref:TnsA endonuclease N-terminal domain-containing protein n=1 Tax=Paenibacillus pabuli TaxID=1472 RepID=UPI0034590E34